ncbi:unnamed protein product [Xylocopa violacea]|uniref:Pacifastin domain-containing protein n=1 Tax=Xylocopa violacea TaxID=135666 RepID=A0ABP1PE70_XYLVO
MSLKLFAFLFLLLVVESFAAPHVVGERPNEDACEPGKMYFDGCNHCFCDQRGAKSCTLILCTDVLDY